MTLQLVLGTTGRAATLGYTFVDASGAAIGSRVTTNIAEYSTTGNYIASSVTIPSNAVGVYWDDSGVSAYNGYEALEDPVKVNLIDDSITSGVMAASAITEIQSGLSTLDAAGVRTAVGLASANLDTQLDAIPTAAENADKLIGRSVEGSADGGHTVGEAFGFLRNKWTVSGSTLTVYRTDGSTTWWTGTVSTNASADPIVGNTPS